MPNKNKEMGKIYCQRYREQNRLKISLYQKKRYGKKKEILISQMKEYRKKNLTKLRFNQAAYSKIYSKTGYGIFLTLKNSAKGRNIDFYLQREEFKMWYDSQEKVCIYCGIEETNLIKLRSISSNLRKSVSRLTIDRLDNNVGYRIYNLGLCCDLCNRIKSDVFTEKEMRYIGETFLAEKLNT